MLSSEAMVCVCVDRGAVARRCSAVRKALMSCMRAWKAVEGMRGMCCELIEGVCGRAEVVLLVMLVKLWWWCNVYVCM